MTSHQLDGVFFDYEGDSLSEAEKQGYTDLAHAVSDKLAPLNASLFVCVGGRPTYEHRDYDYAGLAEHVDFLFVMMYDMHLWDDYTCEVTSQVRGHVARSHTHTHTHVHILSCRAYIEPFSCLQQSSPQNCMKVLQLRK